MKTQIHHQLVFRLDMKRLFLTLFNHLLFLIKVFSNLGAIF